MFCGCKGIMVSFIRYVESELVGAWAVGGWGWWTKG